MTRQYRIWIYVIGMMGVLILTSCQSLSTPRLVLWHSWDGEQADVINRTVNRFSQIFDDVVVVASYVPADEMVDRYRIAAQQGLGPDIFVASDSAMHELATEKLIRPLPANALNQEQYYSVALATASFDEQYYAVPFAMQPLALYYNVELIDSPATTLTDLLSQADAGFGVAINTQFRHILWGIQSYGGQLFDDDGRVILNRGAFTNWLNWLLNANANPEVFLSRDTTTLQRLFTSERVAYYTGLASELTSLRDEMGGNKIGVVPLPSGPNGASGPLMQTDVLMFNPSSSPSVQQTALDLALFLTNLEQANSFMRDLDLVPTNRRVRVDLRTYPAIAGFIAQTRTALAFSQQQSFGRVLEVGDDLLLRVLEGVITPNTASQELTSTLNAELGFDTIDKRSSCELEGDLVVWHSLNEQGTVYLSDTIDQLNQDCTDFEVALEFVSENVLLDAYLVAYSADDAPDMILTDTANLQQLVRAEAVQPVDRALMQSFLPIGQETVALNGIPYGIPIALVGNVFYYNRDQVIDAPVTTDELLVERSPRFVISRNVDRMLWTITAYNGITVTDSVISADLDQLNSWLRWLNQLRSASHVEVVNNAFLRRGEFIQGTSAYYVDSNLALHDLSLALGDDLGVAPFPTGTSPFASPLVTSLALFVNPNSPDRDNSFALAEALTGSDMQEQMVQDLSWIPTNTVAAAGLNNDPILSIIAQVLQSGVVINDDAQGTLTLISQSIDRVLRTDQRTEDVAQELFDQITNDSEVGE